MKSWLSNEKKKSKALPPSFDVNLSTLPKLTPLLFFFFFLSLLSPPSSSFETHSSFFLLPSTNKAGRSSPLSPLSFLLPSNLPFFLSRRGTRRAALAPTEEEAAPRSERSSRAASSKKKGFAKESRERALCHSTLKKTTTTAKRERAIEDRRRRPRTRNSFITIDDGGSLSDQRQSARQPRPVHQPAAV